MIEKQVTISSMTGFGRGESSRDSTRVVFELSSVNSRFLEVSLRLPRWLLGMEATLRGLIEKRLSRGKVFGQLTWERTDSAPGQTFNAAMADWYIETLEKVGRRHQMAGTLALGDLVRIPELWSSQTDVVDEEVESLLQESLGRALEQLSAARQTEGRALAEDLRRRVQIVEECVGRIRAIAETVPAAIRDKLGARVQELLGSGSLDQQRLAQEVAYMAERADITEECVRLLVHTRHFIETLDGKDAVGRRLNFLTQELNREANTIASKSVSAEISTIAVQLKEELERIREQVQNLE